MTEKELANHLANKFVTKSVFNMTNEELKEQRKQAKKHAITCVDEIIKQIRETLYAIDIILSIDEYNEIIFRWERVKDEINKL